VATILAALLAALDMLEARTVVAESGALGRCLPSPQAHARRAVDDRVAGAASGDLAAREERQAT
jgi:hypothetical protein